MSFDDELRRQVAACMQIGKTFAEAQEEMRRQAEASMRGCMTLTEAIEKYGHAMGTATRAIGDSLAVDGQGDDDA